MLPTGPHQETEAEKLYKSFISCLTILSSLNREILESNSASIFPGNDIKDRTTFIEEWMLLKSTAEIMPEITLEIILIESFYSQIQTFVTNFNVADNFRLGLSLENVQSISEIVNPLVQIIKLFHKSNLESKIPSAGPTNETPIDFKNDIPTFLDNIKALDEYESMAHIIRLDSTEYRNSRLYELEQLLLDPLTYLRRNPSSRGSSNVDVSSCFVALAAPSMEGKTQSAFVFKDVRPLYFPLSAVSDQTYNSSNNLLPRKTQNIYENYRSLTTALYCYANEDMIEIQQMYNSRLYLSATSIKINLKGFRSRVLGFLVALIEDARRPEVQNQSWMRYHSKRPDFSFSKLSINDIQSRPGLFKGFILFLDEFVGTPWAVYVRNLSRAIELICLVANTNTTAANLVGSQITSGYSDFIIWSIVVTSLGPSSIAILDQLFQLSSSIRLINQYSSDPGVSLYLENFVNEQINHMRPGMAMFLAQAIVDYAQKNHQNINLKDFLDDVLNNLAMKMRVRIFQGSDVPIFNCANIGLLLSESFEQTPSNIEDYSWLCKGFSFLQNHLYCLVNPTGNENWLFLTSPPIGTNKFLRIVYNNSSVELQYERTFFDSQDTSTILACLFLGFQSTITGIMSRAESVILQSPNNVYNAQNENALKRNGNALEVSAAISVIDASHHQFGIIEGEFYYENYSIGGQNGIDFLKNLIINLIDVNSKYDYYYYKLLFAAGATFRLDEFFKKIQVPFLYSLNREDVFLDKLNNISNSVYIKKLERTSDSQKFDGKFEFKYEGQRQVAVVECKNYSDKVSRTLIHDILDKSLKHKPKLILIFCNKIVDGTDKQNKLTKLCDKKKINIYKVKRSQDIYQKSKILIVPFDEASDYPEIICLIFESKTINDI